MSVIASSIYILCVVQDTASFVNAQIIGAVTRESAVLDVAWEWLTQLQRQKKRQG